MEVLCVGGRCGQVTRLTNSFLRVGSYNQMVVMIAV